MLREYALSTKEGLALMVLAEALLRVPDAATADRLIEDKLGQGDFAGHEAKSDAFLVSASAWALGITARIIQPGETPEGILARPRQAARRCRPCAPRRARPCASWATISSSARPSRMRSKRAGSGQGRLYRYSFDMLGEGARTAADARRYFDSYAAAIDAIGRSAGNEPLPNRPGISVKLSALHPRYEALSRERVMRRAGAARDRARATGRGPTTSTSPSMPRRPTGSNSRSTSIAAVLADPSLAGWDGFGLAIQAYQKRAGAVIDYVAALAERHDRRLMVRLVKGAYWDTEVKRAQERGLDDYPVFTRKAMTDLNYMACAEQLLALRPRIYPQFATHNALTVASIIERAGGVEGYEFQRLHGMGEALYERLIEDHPGAACRTYAPVGGHRDLLAYLVRRLLENGANSSFVSVAADPAVPGGDAARAARRHHRLAGARAPSEGPPAARSLRARPGQFPRRRVRPPCLARRAAGGDPRRRALGSFVARPIVSGRERAGARAAGPEPDRRHDGRRARRRGRRPTRPGARSTPPGQDFAPGPRPRRTARRGPAEGRRTDGGAPRGADPPPAGGGRQDPRRRGLGGARGGRFLPLLRRSRPRRLFGAATAMPGPTGESNVLRLRGRGVFVAISPWNFPLAIFIGQIAAALVAGNTVVAKPAEQTPLIAAQAVRMLHEAGVPRSALHLVPGDGRVGARLVEHRDVAGVVFTGSTEVARLINRALAAKDGPIVPLIAETGGINAMIVDATALPEQVADDVVTSAFRSAGQRCSALRLLCVQEDVADKMIEMIVGAAARAEARRSARRRDPYRAGDRRRGEGAARRAHRRA